MSNKRKNYSEHQYIILYDEVDGLCPLCTIPLIYAKANKLNKRVNLAHIYPHSPTENQKKLLDSVEKLYTDDVDDIKNIIWLCPNCHENFDKPRTLDGYNHLLNLKKKLIQNRKIREEYYAHPIEEEIKKVLHLLADENSNEETLNLVYDPKAIESKLNATIQPLTKRKIKRDVCDFYHIIKKEFQNIDTIKINRATLIATQIKAFYLKSTEENTNQEDIFNYLVEWLDKKTSVSKAASSIVISYFVQNCEVFDVIS